MPSREEHKEIKVLEKHIDVSMKKVLKGTDWKKKKNSVFQDTDNNFFSAFFTVGFNKNVRIKIETKPMEIDSLFWEIFQLTNNEKEPLSFRAWGWFTCPQLMVNENFIQIEDINSANIAAEMLENVESKIKKYREENLGIPFSERIKKHEKHLQNGAYGISLVVSLICEGKLDEARKLATAYETEEFICNYQMSHHKGESFNQLAIKWIDAML